MTIRRNRLILEPLEQRRLLATFVVTSGEDAVVQHAGDAPGTFRQAVFDANALPGHDVITFAPELERVAITDQIYINDSVEVRGGSAIDVTIENTSNSTGIRISGEATFRNLTLKSYGRVCGPAEDCAAKGLFEAVDLSLFNVRILGGIDFGIRIIGGTLTIESSVVSGLIGTGIQVSQAEAITIRDSTISDNIDRGIAGSAAEILIERSTISGNSTSSRLGGAGIRSSGNLIIRDSLVTNNHTEFGRGGGIYAIGDVTIDNSTVSGNSARIAGGGVFFADNSEAPEHSFKILNSTITQNRTSQNISIRSGGGVYVQGGNVVVSNSIIAHNDQRRLREPSARDIALAGSSSLIISHSLIGDVSGTGLSESHAPDANGNILGGPELGLVDPRLEPLAYNGGATLVHPLLPDSPAVDAAMAEIDGPEFDQRGPNFGRVSGNGQDMGAFELQTIAGDFDGDFVVGCAEVDQLAAAIVADGGFDEKYDLNGDAMVDHLDMDELMSSIATHRLHSRAPWFPGDANLDGAVDGTDFNIWANNFTRSASGACQADFNLDGTVDESDYIVWTENRFRTMFDAEDANRYAVPRTARFPRAPFSAVADSLTAENGRLGSKHSTTSTFRMRHLRRR